MEMEVINNKVVLSKKNLIANCDKEQVSNDSEIFVKIFGSDHSGIKTELLGKDGDVVFSLPQKSIGLTDEDIKKYAIIRTNYFANFVGEFLVRKNINKFLKMLLDINTDEYRKVVCGFNHKNFGMFVCAKSKTFKFQFHISLVQSILTEDLNNIISIKK